LEGTRYPRISYTVTPVRITASGGDTRSAATQPSPQSVILILTCKYARARSKHYIWYRRARWLVRVCCRVQGSRMDSCRGLIRRSDGQRNSSRSMVSFEERYSGTCCSLVALRGDGEDPPGKDVPRMGKRRCRGTRQGKFSYPGGAFFSFLCNRG
jgi:hypothetical protein